MQRTVVEQCNFKQLSGIGINSVMRKCVFVGVIALGVLSYSDMKLVLIRFSYINQDWFLILKTTWEGLQSFNSSLNYMMLSCHGDLQPADGARLLPKKRSELLVLRPLLITIHFKGWKAVFREKSLLAQSLCICERQNYIPSSFKE